MKLIRRIFIAVCFSLCSVVQAADPSTFGALESVQNGVAKGWAANPASPEQSVPVQFYVDGPRGQQGTQLFFEATAQRQFEAPIPSNLGDGQAHALHAYAMIQGEAHLLKGSPMRFRFKSRPPVSLKILSPTPGYVLAGSTLSITYSVSGDTTAARHAHWQIDNGPELMDMDFTGTYVVMGLAPGPHILHGSLARGHHEKVLNSDVSVKFKVKGTLSKTTGNPKAY